jgi:outer membrane murein-binding lipoprotein Lpp
MQKNKKFLLFASIMISGLLIAGISARVSTGESSTYEIQPEITLPQYRSDTARLIDSYERTVNRVLDARERDSRMVNYKMEKIGTKIDKLTEKVDKLSERMERIEKKLGIEQPTTANPPADNNQTSGSEKQQNHSQED